MASDGKIEIDIELNDSKAASQATKAGNDIAKGVENGLKNVSKAANNAADSIKKPFESAASSAKSSMEGVGDAAKNSFSDVGDAAKDAASDAADAFEDIPADAEGAFSDVASEAESGFDGVADAASNSASDASSAFQDIPADAEGAFSDVASEAEAGFSGVADAAKSATSDAAGAFDTLSDAAENAGHSVENSLNFSTLVGAGVASQAITDLAGKLVDLGKRAIEVGADFDKSMSQVAATMGVATDEVQDLRKYAQQMGESTAFSASQAADALNYMALAGYDAETSMRVLPTVLNLAAAGNMELAAASDMVTDAQSALGLSVEQAEVMVDQMAKTSSKTNTSVEQLGNAFLTVGGTAKNLKGGTAELAEMLGILADNGIKGSEGGTALRNVILSLSAPTDKAAKSIEALGLQVFDAQGNMRPMPDIIKDLNASLSPLTQQEKTNVLNNIFNKVDLKSVNALLGTSADRFDEVAGAIDNAAGSAQKMAETQLDNLAGDVTLLESATEGFFIAVSDELNPALRELTQFATNQVMPAATNMVKNFDKIAPAIAGIAVAIAVLKARTKIMTLLADESGKLAKAVGMSTKEFQAMTTAQKATTVATNGLKTAMGALKSVGIVLAISAAVEVFSMASKAIADANERTQKFNQSTEGLRSAASGIAAAVGAEADAFGDLASNVAKIDLDEITQQHIDLAQSINDVNQSAESNQSMLTQYNDVIQQLGDGGEVTDEQLAQLKVAVDGVNEACGTGYQVVTENGKAYLALEDGSRVAASAINEVVEAQKAQIRAQAEAENYKALWEQMAKDEQALAEATRAQTEAQERLNAKIKELGDSRYTTNQATGEMIDLAAEEQAAYDASAKALSEVQSQADATQSALNKVSEQQTLTAMVSDKSASALLRAADANSKFKAGVQSMDVDLVAFTKALEQAGFSEQQIADMTVEQAQKMAKGWSEGTDQLLAATEEVGVEVPSKLREMGEQAAKVSGESGDNAGKSFTDGLSKNAQLSVKAALNTVGMTTAEFDKLAAKAKIEGDDAAIAFANAIAKGEGQAKSAGATDSNAAASGMGSSNTAAVGTTLVTKFAEALTKGKDKALSGGKTNANSARDGMKSQDGNAGTWGSHLVSNFASGMRGAASAAFNAASSIANTVKSVLGHTIPKEGVLREGGRGEAVWGQHLVENIADGMTSVAAKRAIKQATKEVAVDINESLMNYMEDINPLVQLEESLAKGSSAFSISAALSGTSPSYTTNNQTLNFNQAVRSPDEIARALRMEQRYGLAGNR